MHIRLAKLISIDDIANIKDPKDKITTLVLLSFHNISIYRIAHNCPFVITQILSTKNYQNYYIEGYIKKNLKSYFILRITGKATELPSLGHNIFYSYI